MWAYDFPYFFIMAGVAVMVAEILFAYGGPRLFAAGFFITVGGAVGLATHAIGWALGLPVVLMVIYMLFLHRLVETKSAAPAPPSK